MDFDFTTETITPDVTSILTIGGTGGIEISVGTTGERPITPINGTIRYNTTDSKFEFYQASAWINIGSSPLTTKGDLYTHNATIDTRLPVGSSGYFLKANPATATGLEWVQNPAIALAQVNEEPTGFPNRTDSKISFVNGTRIFTIQPNSPATQFSVYQRGIEFVKTAAETITIPNTTALYYIYYDTAGVLQQNTTGYDLSSQAPVSIIYWNAVTGYATLFGEERHGLVMDWSTHEYLHTTRGTQYVSGLPAGNYTTTGTGDNNSDAQIGVAGGVIADEDINLTIVNSATPTAQFEQTISPLGYFPVLYRLGTAGIWYKDTATSYPFKMGTTYPVWNENTGATWVTTEVNPNAFIAMWLLATNDVNQPIVALMGQEENVSLINARRFNNFYDLDLGGVPFLEFRPLYRLIFEVKTSFTNDVSTALRDVLDIRLSPTVQIEQATATGTVTSIDVSGGTTGLVATGGPITSAGVITLSGAVATTSAGLPTGGTAGQFLSKIDGTNYNTTWADPSYTNTDATLYKATTNNQAATDPGPGRIKWNNVTQINSTEIYIDIINDNGTDISAYLARLTLASIIWIQRQSNSAVYQRWALTSITNNSGWYTLGVTLIDENLGQFSNNENIVFAANIIGTGSVTNVSSSSTVNGLTLTTTNPNTTPVIALAGTLATTSGGTGLTSIGTANQVLGVNTGATGLEYKTITAGTAISVTPAAGSITITNTGVTSAVAGTGISVSSATGAVTFTNTGVTSFSAGTTGFAPSSPTSGAITLSGTLLPANGGTGASATPTSGQIPIGNVSGSYTPATITAGSGISVTNGNGSITIATTGGSGTVTSVGLALPSIFTVSGSPVTTTGTLTGTFNTQTANTIFSGPTTGGAATPTFRTLVFNDISSALQLYRENPSTPTTPVASGNNSVAIGSGSSATGVNAYALGAGTAASVDNVFAYANGNFATAGDSQNIIVMLRRITSDAAGNELFIDGTSQRMVLPNNSAWTFTIRVVGRRTDTTGTWAMYTFAGGITRDGTAATTVLRASSRSIIDESTGALNCTIAADTTNGSLNITVTGIAGQTIRWVATAEITQVTN